MAIWELQPELPARPREGEEELYVPGDAGKEVSGNKVSIGPLLSTDRANNENECVLPRSGPAL